MAVAQTQHNLQIVLGEQDYQLTRSGNVPSGTVVDDMRALSISPVEPVPDTPEEAPSNMLFERVGDAHLLDFYMTSHGGLKVRTIIYYW